MFETIKIRGSYPAVNPQIDNPRVLNAFVDNDGYIDRLPSYDQLGVLTDARAVYFSYKNNTYFIASRTALFEYRNLTLTRIGAIDGSDKAYRFAENTQSQIILVNGLAAYVYDQNTKQLTKLSPTQGFDFQTPVDVIVINTFTIIGDSDTYRWIVSAADNALSYNNSTPQLLDARAGRLTALGNYRSNLFVFSENAVERWVPGVETVSGGAFPFYRDSSFLEDYGAVSTASVSSYNNAIYYFSNDGHVREISADGARAITTVGIANKLGNFNNLPGAVGTFYNHKGSYFYQLSFAEGSWVFNVMTNGWSESELFLRGYDGLALQDNSFGVLGSSYSNTDKVVIQTPYAVSFFSNPTDRIKYSQVWLSLDGTDTVFLDQSRAVLQVSQDNVSFGPAFAEPIPTKGTKNFYIRWTHGLTAADGFTFRITLWYPHDFSIRGVVLAKPVR